jgi:hypothetical protein
MLEAAAIGKPMLVTDVGALQDYFSPEAASYVPPFDAQALRDAADKLVAAPADALRQARSAAAELLARDLTTQHFAQQHVQITRDLLRRRASPHGMRHAEPAAAGSRAAQAHTVEQRVERSVERHGAGTGA